MVLEEKRKPGFKSLAKFVGGLLGGVVYILYIYCILWVCVGVHVCACA